MKISYYLPKKHLNNDELSKIYEGWTSDKIFKKTGIKSRHISDDNEFCSDMAVRAAENLFKEYDINKKDIEFLVLATQSPDYALPTTACIVQNKLKLEKTVGALDINLGCSAFVYGLSIAKAMVSSGIVDNVLLITSEMYTKRIHPMDKSVRTIFGDGAAAVLIEKKDALNIGNFEFGTDGSGYDKLIIPASGIKELSYDNADKEQIDSSKNVRTAKNIFMDGSAIFNFTIDTVPECIENVLEKNNMEKSDIDMFVFHQANKFMLDHLRKILDIPKEKYIVDIETTGNLVSASIPIALKNAELAGKIKKGDKVLIVGYGVGLSWGAVVIKY